jgi:aspartyl-tRNA(Asn)/glutamyl-tRNA(Gln) amidotransferase subunit C
VKIDAAEVLRIAKLANLDLRDDEVARLATELSSILTHVEMLGGVDTSGIEATFHPREYGGPLREDEPRPCLSAEEATRGAPGGMPGAFLVPRIIG